jgi:hypothetical protein
MEFEIFFLEGMEENVLSKIFRVFEGERKGSSTQIIYVLVIIF